MLEYGHIRHYNLVILDNKLNGRQPQWKTTSMEYDLNGMKHQWRTTSIEEDLKQALQEAYDISLSSWPILY